MLNYSWFGLHTGMILIHTPETQEIILYRRSGVDPALKSCGDGSYKTSGTAETRFQLGILWRVFS